MLGIFRWLLDPPAAGLGIEFRNEQLVLARFADKRGRKELDLCLKAPLPPDVLEFSMLEPNIKDPEGLSAFLKQLLEQAGVRRRRIAVTLPDTLARLSVAELPEAPRSKNEVTDLLRFRLKKSLPFGTNEARICFAPVPGKTPSYLNGVMHEDVVSQYEKLLSGLGFHVGVVETSSLSLLNLWQTVADREIPSSSDYFFVNAEEHYFSIILIRNRVPLLVRTLGQRTSSSNGPGNELYQLDDVVREIVPTLIFHREKLEGNDPAKVYFRSLRPDLPQLPDVLEEQFGAPVERFDLLRVVAMEEKLSMEESLGTLMGAAAGAAHGKVI